MPINRTESEQKRANEMFDALRDELLKRELSNTESYDKSILTLSSTALAISLTAIKFVVPLETADMIWLVKTGWVLLLISIIISLVAFLMSNQAISVQIKNAEDYYIHGKSKAFNRPNVYITINTILNLTTGLIFIIAISLIVLFVTFNIKQVETLTMSEKSNDSNKVTLTIANESANIPRMQRIPIGTGLGKNSANIPSMQQALGTETTSQSGEESSSSGSDSTSTSDESK